MYAVCLLPIRVMLRCKMQNLSVNEQIINGKYNFLQCISIISAAFYGHCDSSRILAVINNKFSKLFVTFCAMLNPYVSWRHNQNKWYRLRSAFCTHWKSTGAHSEKSEKNELDQIWVKCYLWAWALHTLLQSECTSHNIFGKK